MEWIIWTCGWWLVTGYVAYLSETRYDILYFFKSSSTARRMELVFILVIWIIGMIKFW